MTSRYYDAITSRGLTTVGRRRDWRHRLSPSDQRDLEVALLEARLREDLTPEVRAQTETAIAALKRLNLEGGVMSRHDNAYQKVLSILADHVVTPGQMLKDLEAKREMFPPQWYEGERQRLIRAARVGDDQARDALNAYAESALADARKLRAQREADRDPATRTAEIAERAALLASDLDAGDIAEQAAAMLAAERPERAAFLLSVARSARNANTAVLGIAETEAAVRDALDASDETLARARAIEDAVTKNVTSFDALRLRALAASGIGVTADGRAGSGAPGEAASANAGAKLAAWASGGDFSDAESVS